MKTATLWRENLSCLQQDYKINSITKQPCTFTGNTTNLHLYKLFAFDLCIRDCVINLLIIYRYPSTSGISTCNNLADTLENNVHALKGLCILTGNFNICTEDPLDNDTRTFIDMLDSLGMVNHITYPTHKQGHTLDLVIEEEDSLLIVVTHMKIQGFHVVLAI